MSSCAICSTTFSSNSYSFSCIDASPEELVAVLKSFENVPKDNAIRRTVTQVFTRSEYSLQFSCKGKGIFDVCNPCLVQYGVVSTLKKELLNEYPYLRLSIEDIQKGRCPCSSCNRVAAEEPNIMTTSTLYGIHKEVDLLLEDHDPVAMPKIIRAAVRVAVGLKPPGCWIILSIPRKSLILCERCFHLSLIEADQVESGECHGPHEKSSVSIQGPWMTSSFKKPSESSKIPTKLPSEVASQLPIVLPSLTPFGFVPQLPPSEIPSPFESSSLVSLPELKRSDVPYVDTTKEPNKIIVGSTDETFWKVHLIHTGQESSMWSIHRWTKTLDPLDWNTKIVKGESLPVSDVQNDIIIQRLESILDPPRSSMVNTENRYARYLLEVSEFAELENFTLKLCKLFKTLLSIYVTCETFPAFRAVYVGLWNLCTNDKERRKICKLTLKLFSQKAYRTTIFKLLLKHFNLLSFYEHGSMLRHPKVNEEIWFHNYKYLTHVAKMRRLEGYLNPVPVERKKKCVHMVFKQEEKSGSSGPTPVSVEKPIVGYPTPVLVSKPKSQCPPAPKIDRIMENNPKGKSECARVLFPAKCTHYSCQKSADLARFCPVNIHLHSYGVKPECPSAPKLFRSLSPIHEKKSECARVLFPEAPKQGAESDSEEEYIESEQDVPLTPKVENKVISTKTEITDVNSEDEDDMFVSADK